jgi:hypothetical protein
VSLDQLPGRRECVYATISTDKELTLESVKDFKEQRKSLSEILLLSFAASAGFSLELALPYLRTLSPCCNPFSHARTISSILFLLCHVLSLPVCQSSALFFSRPYYRTLCCPQPRTSLSAFLWSQVLEILLPPCLPAVLTAMATTRSSPPHQLLSPTLAQPRSPPLRPPFLLLRIWL